jgi:hypothetical protein
VAELKGLGFVLFRVVKVHVFAFLFPYCDIHYDFRVKTMFSFSSLFTPICYVGGSRFICVDFFLNLYTYTGVQHDFHVTSGTRTAKPTGELEFTPGF